MPHRKNAKGDIGTAKKFSDSYDMDNIYLAEEGWVYRHFKNTKRTRWWDEIIVSGQVVPEQQIHGVPNTPVELTNPPKLGTVEAPTFQEGDSIFDYRYSNHTGEGVSGDPDVPTNDPDSGNSTDSIGTVTISGPRNFNVTDNQSFTWAVSGGDFTKSQLKHRWFIVDKSDAGSGMSGEAKLTTGNRQATAYVDGTSSGAVQIGIEITAEASNSPVVVIYDVTVI
jgi:hypothetical protein